MKQNGVRSLMMGGQACVLYGAAEFSRDLDLAIQVDEENLSKFRDALAELDACVIAVPPFEVEFLKRGHAVHFRSRLPEMHRLRIDVMTRLRGVDSFEDLWARRTTISVDDLEIDLLAISDLIAAKRTQREKDWPMTNRLVEAHYLANAQDPDENSIRFWLKESFDLKFLQKIVKRFPAESRMQSKQRPVIAALLTADIELARSVLREERRSIEVADEAYWAPLVKELQQLRSKSRNA